MITIINIKQNDRKKCITVYHSHSILTSLILQLEDIKWNTEWKKLRPTVSCLQKTHIPLKETHRIKWWKMVFPFHINGSQMKASVALMIFAESLQTTIIGPKWQGGSLLRKGKRNNTTRNFDGYIYALNISALNFMKQILLKVKEIMGPSKIRVGHSNIPLSPMHMSLRKKVNSSYTVQL